MVLTGGLFCLKSPLSEFQQGLFDGPRVAPYFLLSPHGLYLFAFVILSPVFRLFTYVHSEFSVIILHCDLNLISLSS